MLPKSKRGNSGTPTTKYILPSTLKLTFADGNSDPVIGSSIILSIQLSNTFQQLPRVFPISRCLLLDFQSLQVVGLVLSKGVYEIITSELLVTKGLKGLTSYSGPKRLNCCQARLPIAWCGYVIGLWRIYCRAENADGRLVWKGIPEKDCQIWLRWFGKWSTNSYVPACSHWICHDRTLNLLVKTLGIISARNYSAHIARLRGKGTFRMLTAAFYAFY